MQKIITHDLENGLNAQDLQMKGKSACTLWMCMLNSPSTMMCEGMIENAPTAECTQHSSSPACLPPPLTHRGQLQHLCKSGGSIPICWHFAVRVHLCILYGSPGWWPVLMCVVGMNVRVDDIHLTRGSGNTHPSNSCTKIEEQSASAGIRQLKKRWKFSQALKSGRTYIVMSPVLVVCTVQPRHKHMFPNYITTPAG